MNINSFHLHKNKRVKPRRIYLALLLPLLIGMFSCNLTRNQRVQETAFIFYNVENLFDTIDTPDKNDQEFTPESEKAWNTARYQKKINDLSRVIAAVNEEALPAFIGLAEIENREVLEALAESDFLKDGKFRIAHKESPDRRGIDVALLYNPDVFTYLYHHAFEVTKDYDRRFKTRDILYVKGLIDKKDTLHIFINHWPSRYGGQEKSEPNRLLAASVLRIRTDSILKKNPEADILIAGDFNDEPHNKSISEILEASNDCATVSSSGLYSLFLSLDKQGVGTYNYRGEWNMIDNIIVSAGMLQQEKGELYVHCDSGKILRKDWMMYDNTKIGEKVPNRTYGGNNYFGGISDHLPVYVVLKRK